MVRGTVQGVGFRPFVYGLATELGLSGFVRNEASLVVAEVEGARDRVRDFAARLERESPPLARIEGVVAEVISQQGASGFSIVESRDPGGTEVTLPVDVAPCDACLAELFDPNDRRFEYPFLNCTHCGPRLTVIKGVPYDRAATTLAGFPLCGACQREYDDPKDRRFHAQPTACPDCGPSLSFLKSGEDLVAGARDWTARVHSEPAGPRSAALMDMSGPAREGALLGGGDFALPFMAVACPSDGQTTAMKTKRRVGSAPPSTTSAELHRREPNSDADLIDRAVSALKQGLVVAVKGVGGFHLAVDAKHEGAVRRLRERKRRDARPFAVMVVDLAAARSIAVPSSADELLLQSPQRPIVLVPKRAGAGISEAIAPEQSCVGVLLPYSPLHYLLLAKMGGPLVLTSGNLSDAPIAFEDGDAHQRLGAIADALLGHNRPIHLRCDDSVAKVIAGEPVLFRRARGFAPEPRLLAQPLKVPTLAVGAQLKSTFALGQGNRATLSHHLGDLDHLSAFEAFGQGVAHFERLLRITPARVAHDLHPDYASTRYAEDREFATRVAIQHHHAHFASCLAENGHGGPALGIVFDGSGLGEDGTLWGGEFLFGTAARSTRVGHLEQAPVPGGHKAFAEPWRMALSHAMTAGLPLEQLRLPAGWDQVARLIERGFNAPLSSSVGRLFDAVAWLLGGPSLVSFEGQAAMWLEAQAARSTDDSVGSLPAASARLPAGFLFAATLEDLKRGTSREDTARRFHLRLAELTAGMAGSLAAVSNVSSVALSGGVFANALLTTELLSRLQARGLTVLRHRYVPPNDGGIAFGQLACLAARDAEEQGVR